MNATEINRLISSITGVQRDYFHCLNACKEFEKMLNHEQRITYWNILFTECMVGDVLEHGFRIVSATATQRCLAFVALHKASDPTLGADSVPEGKENL